LYTIKAMSEKTLQHTKRRPRWLLWSITAAVVISAGIFSYLVFVPHNTDIRDVTVDGLPAASLPQKLEIQKDKLEQTFTSPELKADFAFNAIVPMWDGTGNGTLQMRTADKTGRWTGWMDIEADGEAVREGVKQVATHYPETPLIVDGQQYQYRIKLARANADQTSPTVTNLKITYIDSRQSTIEKVSSAAKSFFNGRALAASHGPAVNSRADWGSPDPNGDLFKGTDKYWSPEYRQVTQIFLHHTVSPNSQSDPKALIRAIWDYHAKTLGWGDIGYNYIVDGNGNLYQGRYGDDYVVGGHTSGYNYGSMGVAVLGCFEPNSTCNQLNGGRTGGINDATMNGLTNLLSWRTSLYGINPDAGHDFCKQDGSECIGIPTIAAHRQAVGTECNGQYFYDQMNVVRQKTREKNALDWWGINNINFVKKASRGSLQQLFYATDGQLYAAFWGGGYSDISYKRIMSAPLRERFVDATILDETDGSQTLYAATQSSVYQIHINTNDVFDNPDKLITSSGIRKITVDTGPEAQTTWRLDVLASDGPHEYWWKNDGNGVQGGGLLWNINGGLDMVKTKDPASKDELYIATPSNVYRVKWPVNGDIERKTITELPNTVAVDKQTLPDGTELLYTATATGVHETWWNPSHPAFSAPAKLVSFNPGVVDIKKTITADGTQQLYVAKNDEVYEFWWGNGHGVTGAPLIGITQGGITAIDKTTTGAYQNLYTVTRNYIHETWWGNGQLGNGPAIVQLK